MVDPNAVRLAARSIIEPKYRLYRDVCLEAADEIERLRGALTRIQDLSQHNMGMSARDERCVHREATSALSQKEE